MEYNLPTAADYAYSAAQDAKRGQKATADRVAELERRLGDVEARLAAVEARTPKTAEEVTS